MNGICPIWGTSADVESRGHYAIIDSPRAGGKYWISGSAEAVIQTWDKNHKKCLTTRLCEQRAAVIEVPRIEDGTLQLIRSRKPLSVSRRMTRALVILGDMKIGSYRQLVGGADVDTLKAYAETESVDLGELRGLYHMLKENGYVHGQFYAGGEFEVAPTMEGWGQIERLTVTANDSSQAFVAMWFDPSMDDVYNIGIAPAVSATGHKALRIDNKEHVNKIDDEIIAEIRRSRFLIADFTCRPKDIRGGVYYEAGFAQGIGIPVIWTCCKDSENDLHFDTRQYAHIMWDTPEDLFEKLKNRIGAVIGEGPLPKV